MEVIYSLIPGMTFFGLVMVGVLVWAIRRGQYEDMEGNASRILLDDDEDALVMKQDDSQTHSSSAPESGKNGKS